MYSTGGSIIPVRGRRWVFFSLNAVSFLAALAVFARVLVSGPVGLPEIVMLLGFAVAMPYTLVGFWNAVIGWAVLRRRSAQDPVAAMLDSAAPLPHIDARCALLMTLRNETPEPVFARLAAMAESLCATGYMSRFQFVVLSDSDDEEILAREADLFAGFAARWRHAPRPIYRHRDHNHGYKAGNIMAFLDGCGDRFDYFLPLDADSVMSGSLMVRLVAALQANPQIGILQTLVVGLPASSVFARVFQFGMRHAMRVFTAGAAWWSADCGPYWGHNALVRLAPFRRHCRLPEITRAGVLSGAVMSHDQLEAAFMRRAGYEVRVAAVECDSFEINPPTLADFIRRELRWCQGNLQYAWLIGAPGLLRISRIQLLLAMLMYLAPPAWLAMIVAASARAAHGGLEPASLRLGLGLLLMVFVLSIGPKIVGALSVVMQRAPHRPECRRYGPPGLFVVSVLLELVLSMLMAPVVAVAISLFILGLPFGRQVRWSVQKRRAGELSWGAAIRHMGPATAVGIVLLAWLARCGPWTLIWAAPFLLGLLVCVPLAKFTAQPSTRPHADRRLFVVPEERVAPPIVAAVAVESPAVPVVASRATLPPAASRQTERAE